MLKLAQRILFVVSFFWTIYLSSQTILIDEDFSGGSLPAGWSNVNNGGTAGQIWTFNDPGGRNITAGNISGNYAILDSDDYGSGGNNQNARLITPTFSTGIYETITLEFDYQYREYDGVESCVVEVYNGTTWTEVFRKEIGDENYISASSGANLESIDITSEVGASSSAQVRFVYIGAYDWWWAIDNVKVTGTLPSSSNAYLGPGGVGNTDGTSDLVLWTNPDDITEADEDAFATWSDLSGYSSDLSQGTTSLQPKIKKNIVNGYDVVRFEATNRRLRKTSFTNFPTNNISGFYVNKTSDSNDGVLSYASSAHNNDFLIFSSNSLRMYRSSNVNSGVDANNNVWNIVDFRWKSSGGTARISLNGNSGYSGTLSSGSSITTGGTLALAGEQDSVDGNYDAAQAHQGDFSEVILFKSYLNEAQRIIINNYLSAKYNITLSANNFYDEDTSGGNFDHNVAGIGRATDGSLHLDSQGTGIIRINTPSDLNNDEFLFWGEDVKGADYDFSSSLSTDYLERLDTKWRVSKRNNLGTVSVSVKASDITLNSVDGCNNLKLIVSSSSTFATKTTYDLALSSGVYTATGVSFSDNDYFTIEYKDNIVLDATTAYNGAGASNVPDVTDDCYKLLVKSTADGSPSLTEDADVREVEVEASGKLVIDNNRRLQVTNGIQLDGEIRLVGSSQLIQTHTLGAQITGSGSLYVDQNSDLASVYRYNYWTSPVRDVGSSTFTVKGVMKDGTTATSASSTPPDLAYTTGYDGSTGPLTLSSYWIYGYLNGTDGSTWSHKYESGTFNPGEGYLLKSPGVAQNYTFKGSPNDGDISFLIDADKTSLLGNPYPSAIDANQLFTDSSNLATLLFWEHKNEVNTGVNNEGHYKSGYIGGYSYRNATMGTAADTDVSGTAGLGGETYTAPGRYIAIGQGFFAETATGLAATVNFKNNQRVFVTEAGDSHFFKEDPEKEKDNSLDYSILKLGFEAKNSEGIYIHSQVGISFSEGKTFASETGFDSRKSEIKDSDIYFQLEEGGDKLVIAGVQEISEDLFVPVTLKIDTLEDVFILLDDKENINTNVFIFDAKENEFYDISKPIRLKLAKGTYPNRFFIAFKNKILSVNDDLLNENFNVFQNIFNNELIVKNKDNRIIKNIVLNTLTGQSIIKITDTNLLKEDEIKIKTNKFATSIYVVRITTLQGVVSKKIFIR